MAVHISSLHVGKKPPRVDKVLRLEDNVAQNRMVRSPHRDTQTTRKYIHKQTQHYSLFALRERSTQLSDL